MTDLATAKAALRSVDGQSWLNVKCDGTGTPVVSIQFIPGKFLGSTAKSVTFRFDALPPIASSEWEYAYKGAFNRDEKEVELISKLLAEDHSIFVRAMNYEDQPVDARFNAVGGKTAVMNVLASCGYDTTALKSEGR